jgi:hypothetical protein
MGLGFAELATLEQGESQVPVNLCMIRIQIQQRPIHLHCLIYIAAAMLFQSMVEEGRDIHAHRPPEALTNRM